MSTTPLQPLQLELPGADIIIGAETTVPVAELRGLGTSGLRESVYDNPGEDGRQFGREYREGREIEIVAGVKLPGDPESAWDLAGDLESWFDGEEARKTPRAVTSLRLRRPGSPTKVVFGRPDKFDPDHTLAVVGWIPWSGTFRCVDSKYYSDTEHSTVLAATSTSESYIILDPVDGKLTSPITTTLAGRRSSVVTNAGDTDAWPVIEVKGPITHPSIALMDDNGGILWTLKLDLTLAYDQVAVIDTRPWSRQAALLSGGPLGGALSLESAPSRSTIPPGTWEVNVRGADLTGTSRFTIRWRDAYKKP